MQHLASMRSPARVLAYAMTPGDYGKGVLYPLGAGVALGTLGPFSNLAYGAGMGTATFAALRATLGALLLVAFIRATGHRTLPLARLGPRDRALLALTAVAQAVLAGDRWRRGALRRGPRPATGRAATGDLGLTCDYLVT